MNTSTLPQTEQETVAVFNEIERRSAQQGFTSPESPTELLSQYGLKPFKTHKPGSVDVQKLISQNNSYKKTIKHLNLVINTLVSMLNGKKYWSKGSR